MTLRYGANNQLFGPSALVVPFVACGDLCGFDSDKSYPLELQGEDENSASVPYVHHAPVQPPIRPNYYSYQQRNSNTSGSSARNI